MKSLRRKIDTLFAAVTFAESGEHETALGFLHGAESDEERGRRVEASGGTPRHEDKATVGKSLQDHFMAAAFAEAGEFETAARMVPAYRRTLAVLLAVDGEFPTEVAFDYAVNLCGRLNANLDVLQVLGPESGCAEEPSPELSAMLNRLEGKGVEFNVTVRRAKAGEMLFDYLRAHRDVVTAVVDSPYLRDKQSRDSSRLRTFRDIADKLSVPLVTAAQRQTSH